MAGTLSGGDISNMGFGKFIPLVLFGGLLAFSSAHVATQTPSSEWPAYGGGPNAIRYSPLTQVDRSNVGQLQVAWTYDCGEGPGGAQCQPLVVDGVLYGVTPRHNIVALNAATGELKWKFEVPITGRGPNRGTATWSDGHERCIFCADTHFVYALDAASGKP